MGRGRRAPPRLWKQPCHSQVIENCPVTGIRVRTDDFGVRRVAAVETEHGSIQTPCVVNCAGGDGVLAAEWPHGCSLTRASLGEGPAVPPGGMGSGQTGLRRHPSRCPQS